MIHLTCTKEMASKARVVKFISLTEKDKVVPFLENVRLYTGAERVETAFDDIEDAPGPRREVSSIQQDSDTSMSSSRSCSYCQVQFDEISEQRLHCKLDWHRYNIKQRLVGRRAVTEEDFEKQLQDIENDEENEISASDDSSDSCEDEQSGVRNIVQGSRIHFVSQTDTVFSVAKCLLLDPRARDPPAEADLVRLMEAAPRRLTWAVLMLGGGHFAGAVFRGGAAVAHKTFHAYTVRAKQGGSQGAADNKSGSSHPKSAGASLRRYNEMSLMQHIQDIMIEWKEQFNACQLIFYRATSGNKKILFDSKGSVIDKNDERLRTIPFQTRRATFKEIKRVQDLLCRLEIIGQLDEVENLLTSKTSKQLEKKKPHRSKSREEPNRSLPGLPVSEFEEESGDENLKFAMVTQQVSTLDLKEFDSSPTKRKGKRSKNKKGSGIQRDLVDLDLESSEDEEDSLLIKLKNDLLTAVKSGNNQMLEQLCQTEGISSSLEEIINHQFGEKKSTPLHIAAKDGHKNIIWTLLLKGADPTKKDRQKKVPYMMAVTKDTRNIFRKFMGDYPNKYDYKSAMIPPPLSKEEEDEKQSKQSEKKKAQRQAKKEKEKLVKAEDKKRKEEMEEKDRFLNLSDREKRALAAERRLLGSTSGQVSVSNITRQRCFHCGADITGKTPFEYSDNKFCSISCVKKHRQQ